MGTINTQTDKLAAFFALDKRQRDHEAQKAQERKEKLKLSDIKIEEQLYSKINKK